jgi:hypothetical protein
MDKSAGAGKPSATNQKTQAIDVQVVALTSEGASHGQSFDFFWSVCPFAKAKSGSGFSS